MNNQYNDDEKLIKCVIELDRIFFPKRVSSVNGGEFAIFSADIIDKCENCEPLGEKIKLKGTVCKLEHCKQYKVTCKLAESNEKYGDTYEILFINSIIDLSDKIKQRNFLMSILNEKTVIGLFNSFDNVIDLLENEDVKSLTSVKGIGTKKALKLIETYKESKDYSSIYAELGHLGLTSKMIKKLVEYYHSPDLVVEKVTTNPYSLVNVDGIGFKKADEIASKVGITGSNPNRVKGCIIYILACNGALGRSYLHYQELLKLLQENIGYVEQEIINSVAQQLISEKEVEIVNNGEFIGLTTYFKLEKEIFNHLTRLSTAECKIPYNSNWNDVIKNVEQEQGFEFTEEQFNAIQLFVKSNIMAVTGGAGVGKTSTSKGMMDLYSDYTISCAALSGKAAVRITEATGLEASTIHRLLGYKNGEFEFNEKFKLDTDVVLIDEATMINGELFLALLRAIPSGAKVIMLGDVQQLTPIGSCQVFADILSSNIIPIARLTKPHRQAMKSGIIPTSLKVSAQEHIIKSNFSGNIIIGELQDMELDIFKQDLQPSDKVISHFMKHLKETDNLMEVQIVVPMKLRGDLSTYNINTKVQQLINPIREDREHIVINLDKDHFYCIQIGDKVMNIKNNYNAITSDGESISIFNGNMGIVKDISDGMCTVDFVGLGEVVLDTTGSQNLELAYATTVHKVQGSGFKRVIVGIDSSAYVLLNAELLYTAITRAKQYCVLVGKNSAIRNAVNKREVKNKQTFLSHFLNKELGAQ